jgi:phage gpG-like protein
MAGPVNLDAGDLAKVLRQYERQYGEIGSVFPALAAALVSAVQGEFESAGHGTWPPLAESTLAKRRKHGRGAELLKDTGMLAASIMPEYDGASATAYTNVPYVVYHTSDEPRRAIPYRNPFDVETDPFLDDACNSILSLLAGEAA